MLEAERNIANLKGLLPLIYIIPSYFAHFVVLFAIFRKRNKKTLGTMFFKIYAFSAIMAILSSIFLYPYSRIRYTPALLFIFDAMPDRSIFGTFIYSMSFYFIYAELLMSFIQNFNRASVILFKANYDRYWDTAFYPILFCILLISTVFISHLYFTDVSLQLIDPTDKEKGYDWSARNKLPWFKNSIIIAVIVSFVAIGSLLSHLYVIHYFIVSNKSTQQNVPENQRRKNDAEKRLFIFAIISFLIHAAFAVFQILFIIITDKETIYFLIGIQAYVQDFINLSPPWLLLFVCPQVRKRIYFRKNHTNDSTTAAAAPNTQPKIFKTHVTVISSGIKK